MKTGRVVSTFARAGQKADRALIMQQIRKNLILQTTQTSFQFNIETTQPQITPENSRAALIQTQLALSRPLTILSAEGTYRKTLDSNQIFYPSPVQLQSQNPTTRCQHRQLQTRPPSLRYSLST
ncbi:MAG: hypothetical protein KatS3mg087_0904 [Patescibacteria group bacterium]|nr:MAG: hypothetical protein KatS3mg087_0904 [Patescibacteria group bacterium]